MLSLFVFAGLLLVGGAYWSFDRVVLGMVGARELPVGEAPLLHSTVERLAAIAGVTKPRLYLIPDGLPRSLATGRGPRVSSIAVSTGLVSACPPAELEGVLAHELAHVRHRDVAMQTAVVVLAASIVELSRIGGCLERSLLFVLGPVAAAFVHLLLSPKREFEADRAAAEICGSPHGLADALAAARAGGRARRVQREPGDRAALPVQPVHGGRPRGALRHASAARRACAPAARSRPGVAREAPHRSRLRIAARRNSRRGERRSRGALQAAGSPGCVLFDPHHVVYYTGFASSRPSGRSRSC